jgi:gas vesicle protein
VDIFRDQAGQAVAEMREQMQQVCREMLDQVKEAREELARELPGRLSAAEETFRHNLDRIQERTIDSATEEMRSRASQWKARSEMEMTK